MVLLAAQLVLLAAQLAIALAVLLGQFGLLGAQIDLATLDERHLDGRGLFERMSVRDEQRGIQSLLQRAQLLADAEDLGCVHRDRGQSCLLG